ncbi:MAG: GumC family protein [Candidatus Entotheonellia bacterium]
MNEGRSGQRSDDEEVNLLDYWRVVRTRRRLIVVLCVSAVLATMAYSLWLPKIYESTVTILTPDERSGRSLGLATALAASGIVQSIPGLSIPSMTPQRDVFVSILKSRTMAQDVVAHFHLQQRYEVTFLSDAIRRLSGATTVALSKDGVISVKLEETDPQLAADIANFYVANLDQMLTRFATTEASKQRVFIADRLTETVRELRRDEEALRQFQETNKVIALQEQARGAVETAAQLKGEIMASEVQLEVMRKFATDANSDVVKLKERIQEMKRHLAQMQYGKGWVLPAESRNPGEPRHEIHIPFAQVPELGLELARLMRDVKVQETVYTLLTQQLEQAKIAEARDMPTVQPLDTAVPADRKSKPKIKLNMAIAGITSLLVGVLLAFFLEYLASVKQSPLPQA